LSPPVLEGEGLAEALSWLSTQMAQVYRLHVDLQTAADVPVTDKEMRVLLFQIVRELLVNVFKHAGSDQATVALYQGEEGGLIIRVSDAGRGFDVTAAEARYDGGFGLFSVRERLGLFGGQMVIDSAPGAGTQITIYTPATHKLPALDGA
jgi:two-component system, chemotaxis family, CheB/CheR fusion protein